eukprot:8839888-Alexandrium_andersonii.AAC.1
MAGFRPPPSRPASTPQLLRWGDAFHAARWKCLRRQLRYGLPKTSAGSLWTGRCRVRRASG